MKWIGGLAEKVITSISINIQIQNTINCILKLIWYENSHKPNIISLELILKFTNVVITFAFFLLISLVKL